MLEMDKELHPLSFNMECLHIICAFKLFCRSTFGKLHPLAHANIGLTHHNIFHYCWDQSYYVRLTITIQDILDYRFVWFPINGSALKKSSNVAKTCSAFLDLIFNTKSQLLRRLLGSCQRLLIKQSQTCKKWEWHRNWKLCGVLS
jgi:hypothetical protein